MILVVLLASLLLPLLCLTEALAHGVSNWLRRGAAVVAITTGVTASSSLPSIAFNPVIEAVPTPQTAAGSGGIDAFAAAGKALTDPRQKMKTLSDTDYLKVQKGEKTLSDAPRASKRRALQFCREGGKRSQVKTGKKSLFGEESIDEKTCINKVMDGDEKFIKQILDANADKKN